MSEIGRNIISESGGETVSREIKEEGRIILTETSEDGAYPVELVPVSAEYAQQAGSSRVVKIGDRYYAKQLVRE